MGVMTAFDTHAIAVEKICFLFVFPAPKPALF